MKKVLVIESIHDHGLELLRRRDGVTVEVVAEPADGDVRERIGEAAAVIVRSHPIDADLIAAARKLEVVSRHGVGFDAIDVAALNARGIPLTVVGDVNAVAVAEHTLYLMLAVAKQGFAADRAVRAGSFAERDRLAPTELWQKTLLIVGFGRIGRRVADRCRAFDMTVLVYDPYVPEGDIAAQGCRPVADLRDALSRADVVSLHLPLTEETAGLVGGAELAAMKPTALLINTARGGLVDETALYRALASRSVGGAGLDTFAREPPSDDNPLFGLDNVVLSPHNASLTGECRRRMACAAAGNVLAAFDGTLDPSVVVNRDAL